MQNPNSLTFPNCIELLRHSEIYLCQGSLKYYSYEAENIILVRAEAMHGKLFLLVSSVPAPTKAGVKPFRNRQIANLLVHWTELALISLFTHPPRQIYYKPEPSLVSIDIVATYLILTP